MKAEFNTYAPKYKYEPGFKGNLAVKIAVPTVVGLVGAYTAAIDTVEYTTYKEQTKLGNTAPLEPIPELANSTKKIKVKTSDGLEIGCWDINPNGSKKYILFCHGVAVNRGDEALQKSYLKLLESGCGVLASDYREYGANPGKFSEKGVYKDAQAAYDYLIKKGIKGKNIGIVGHSLGSACATKIASKNEVGFVVMINPMNKATSATKGVLGYAPVPDFVKKVMDKIPEALYPLRFRLNNEKRILQIKSPVHIIHSEGDKDISAGLAKRLYKKADGMKNVSCKIFKDGDHYLNPQKLDQALKFIRFVWKKS